MSERDGYGILRTHECPHCGDNFTIYITIGEYEKTGSNSFCHLLSWCGGMVRWNANKQKLEKDG